MREKEEFCSVAKEWRRGSFAPKSASQLLGVEGLQWRIGVRKEDRPVKGRLLMSLLGVSGGLPGTRLLFLSWSGVGHDG